MSDKHRSFSRIGARDWSALYQQQPAPDEGVYFKREWFNWYDQPPLHLTKYGASDYAVKGKSGDRPFTSSPASIPKTTSTSLISGASRRRRMCGSMRSLT